jgi:hypothetical protein
MSVFLEKVAGILDLAGYRLRIHPLPAPQHGWRKDRILHAPDQ